MINITVHIKNSIALKDDAMVALNKTSNQYNTGIHLYTRIDN